MGDLSRALDSIPLRDPICIRIRIKRPFSLRMDLTPYLVAPFLRLTGLRFDKSWRNAERGLKAFVYRHLLFTPTANALADGGR